jgi:BMFP domain-containing protein YqiC
MPSGLGPKAKLINHQLSLPAIAVECGSLLYEDKRMIDRKKIEEVVDSISKALPPGLLQMQEDVEKNIRAALTATFSKLDLVTREEFDVQTQVLHRTREKLEALEKRVADLEN